MASTGRIILTVRLTLSCPIHSPNAFPVMSGACRDRATGGRVRLVVSAKEYARHFAARPASGRGRRSNLSFAARLRVDRVADAPVARVYDLRGRGQGYGIRRRAQAPVAYGRDGAYYHRRSVFWGPLSCRFES